MNSIIIKELKRVEKLIQLVRDYQNQTTRDGGEIDSILENISEELDAQKASLKRASDIEKQKEIQIWIDYAFSILLKIILLSRN